MKKKVSNDILALVEHCIKTRERCLFMIVGDKARLQIANLHYLLQRVSEKKASVLWCYKKALEVSSHKQKRKKMTKKLAMKGLYDEETENPYELFLRSTDIRYCYYKESHRILGQTFGMLILQDFEALTPNVLCRTIETVEGGGIIIFTLNTMSSLDELYNLTMDVHAKYATHSRKSTQALFIRRFVYSLTKASNCMVVDDELNPLPIVTLQISDKVKCKGRKKLDALIQSLQNDINAIEMRILRRLAPLCVRHGQLKALISLFDFLSKSCNQIQKLNLATLLSARGRGKSATIGLFLSGALHLGLRTIFVLAPTIENVQTVFEFVIQGLNKLQEIQKYEWSVEKRSGFVESVGIVDGMLKLYVKFVPATTTLGQSIDLLVIEEAAAVPIPVVESHCKSGLVVLSSTVGGYEGTGRSLSLKLVQKLKRRDPENVTEITMKEPIRYSKDDSIETWLTSLLCLDGTPPQIAGELEPPGSCELYMVRRDLLFSLCPSTEQFLSSVMAILSFSHYRNTPDDLHMLCDAPAHELFVLTMPTSGQVVAVIHVAIEGKIPSQVYQTNSRAGINPSGDLVPWTLTRAFHCGDFSQLVGIRIVRIAVPPALQGLGYGSQAIKALETVISHYNSSLCNSGPREENEQFPNSIHSGNSLLIDPVHFKPCSGTRVDYVATCFGLSAPLVKFWTRLGYKAVHVRQVANEATGEFSGILIKPLQQTQWLDDFCIDFNRRLVALSSSCWRELPCTLVLALMGTVKANVTDTTNWQPWILASDVGRLDRYCAQLADFSTIADLLPAIASLYFGGRIPAQLLVLQQAILLAIGAQGKRPDAIAEELTMPVNQIMAMLHKIISKVTKVFNDTLKNEVSSPVLVNETP
ncbi:bifunctional tRNA(Met) cytidine acetyltransferase TmcA [Babesia duncani]|uniref:RNA cytidine acetyltransferase n=1 Tax=Babesia duncani TaxID=323732 RepID=A0AAD9PNF0_9APIC|nr:bifunctional tRNA(Met) cytidine acetyltransferase TmcA [Babesia duncani]